MKEKMLNVATAVMAPWLLAQGMYVRFRIPKLEEAGGERSGELGSGETLSLLIVGDSAAAGVGADAQHEALAGQVAHRLSERYALRWQLLAKTGLATSELIHFLDDKPLPNADVILVISGVNDVTSTINVREWLQHMDRLIESLKQRCKSRLLVISPVPPMYRCPALPQPLRWHLSRRVQHFNQHLAKHLKTKEECTDLTFDFPISAEYICRDGFHPSPLGYQLWAQLTSERINEILDKRLQIEKGILPSAAKKPELVC